MCFHSQKLGFDIMTAFDAVATWNKFYKEMFCDNKRFTVVRIYYFRNCLIWYS